MLLPIDSAAIKAWIGSSSEGQVKTSVPESPLLQEQHIAIGDTILEDGEFNYRWLEKLSIVDKEEVENPHPNNFGSENPADGANGNYDESQLNPKGPDESSIKKVISARDLPYEQRTLNKNLLNGGVVVQKDLNHVQKPLHEMIPIPVQKFQSQAVLKIATEEPYYLPISQFMDPAGLGMNNPNIPFVQNIEWYAPLQPPSLQVGSPLSSDSGINSPSSSPNGKIQDEPSNFPNLPFEQPVMQGFEYHGVPTRIPIPDPQTVDSPCSSESGYSPEGSPENHSQWPQDQLFPNHGTYEDLQMSRYTEDTSTWKVSNASNLWIQDSFAYGNGNPMDTMNLPSHEWLNRQYLPTDVFAPLTHPAAVYRGQADLTAYQNHNNPLDLERLCVEGGDTEIHLRQIDPEQYPCLVELAQEQLSMYLSSAEEATAETPPDPVPSIAPHPSPTPGPSGSGTKIKNSGPKNKPPRQERAPQQKRKPNKMPPLDSAKPKICYMVDMKKERTKALWIAVSLISEEEFTKKNKNGRTCLMEVLLEEKLSIERAYLMIQRMKKNGDLLSCKDKDGKNALYLAALRPHIPLASFIAENYANSGLDVNERFFDEGNSLLHCLVEEGDSHYCEMLGELLNMKVGDRRLFNADVTNNKGETPLHLAVRNLSKKSYPFDLTSVDTLLKRGASISIQNSEGETPLHIAAKVACDEKVFQKLFERLSLPPEENQCAMNIQDSNRNTPLHLVAYQINPCNVEKMKKVIKVFLSEKNTRTDVKNQRETTPEGNIHQSCVKEFFDLFHKRK